MTRADWIPLITLWVIGGLSLTMCLISIGMILWIDKQNQKKSKTSETAQKSKQD